MPKQNANLEISLPENPMKRYLTTRTYYTISLDRNYTTLLPGAGFSLPREGPSKEALLLLDTRGVSAGRTREDGNRFPQFSVRGFTVNHVFNSAIVEPTMLWESTLKLYERGGASYLQLLGNSLETLGVNTLAEVTFWVGVGLYGWTSEDTSARNLHPEIISQKWFAFVVNKIDMEMNNSGAAYSHWLVPNQYMPTQESIFSQINTVITVGRTLNDHTKNLIETAQESIDEAKERAEIKDTSRGSNNPSESGNHKRWRYGGIFYEDTLGFSIDPNAPVETNVQSKSRKGTPQISSGGPKGHTTIIGHIEALLKHCPTVIKYLKDNKLYYKVYPRVSTNPTEQIVSYIIKPFIMLPEEHNILPMRRYNYFFGQRNEDVLAFDLQLEGLDQLLPGPHVDTSQSRVVPNPEDSSRAVENYKDSSVREGKTQKAVGGPESQASESDRNNINANFSPSLRDTKIGSGFTPTLPTREEFGTSQTDEAAKQWKALANSAAVHLGTTFLGGGFTIIGDPFLLWDEAQINDFRQKGIDVEGVSNYIIFTVGTPGREFPAVSDVDNFIFSGPYRIQEIKSEFKEDGSFTQTLIVQLKEDAIAFGGATTKVPEKSIDGLVTPQNKTIRKIKTSAPEIPTPTLNIPQPVPTIPSVDPANISTIPQRPRLRDPATGLELDENGNKIDPRTGEVAPGGIVDDF